MNWIIAIGLLAIPFVSTGKAALWKSRAEVEARYGKPLRVEGSGNAGTVCTYNFQRFHVVVTFLSGQSQSERYYRSDNQRLVPMEILKLQSMSKRENYVWTAGNGMFLLVDAQRRGKPIAIAVRFPDYTYPWSFHICTAEFVRQFGVKAPTGQKQSQANSERFVRLQGDRGNSGVSNGCA
jgi:hypothetical protein